VLSPPVLVAVATRGGRSRSELRSDPRVLPPLIRLQTKRWQNWELPELVMVRAL